jgi:hypothetical protein
MHKTLFLSLVLAAAGAGAAPVGRIRLATTVSNADGSRLELTTRFQASERGGATVNEVFIEVEQVPPEPSRPGEQVPPEPIRYRIEGSAISGPGEINPCWMPALFLLAKGYVSPRQVFDALGLQGEITQLSGDGVRVQDRGADGALLGFMLAQVTAMRPDRAPRVAQLIADGGFPQGPCVAPRQ